MFEVLLCVAVCECKFASLKTYSVHSQTCTFLGWILDIGEEGSRDGLLIAVPSRKVWGHLPLGEWDFQYSQSKSVIFIMSHFF